MQLISPVNLAVKFSGLILATTAEISDYGKYKKHRKYTCIRTFIGK
jgi:hypothetical protein